MATPTSSSSSRDLTYDVFPSFRGEDIRNNFLNLFLEELDREMIYAFKDNGMERSKSIWPELVQAIAESRIAVVFFSKNYASSSWCLNELFEIMKCREEFGQVVIPIFYGVDPSHVRKQNGHFGKMFKKTCENRTEEVKSQWKTALTDAANILGYDAQHIGEEAAMIKKVIIDISGKLTVNSNSSNDFEEDVGVEDHITKIKFLLNLESEEEVKIVGIWGPSGIGKTTIARALYSQLSPQFQHSVFMDRASVSKIIESESRICDLYGRKLQLQQIFLSKLFDRKEVVFHLGAVSERVSHLKVLVIIDDFDDLMVLEALARTDWFGRGSRIIVVTTYQRILRYHGVNGIYKVGLPSEDLALQMFCRAAFGSNSPPEGFEKLAVEVARLAGRLPLGLRVLGSSLQGKDRGYWTKTLPRLENELDGNIEKTLRSSYDGLYEYEKAIFRNIACLFNLEKVDDICLMLRDSYVYRRETIHSLFDKSIINFREDIMEMHPLLQKLGKEIVLEQSHNPGEREFLVDAKDICYVLKENTGTHRVLGISLDQAEIDELSIHENAFRKMHNLHFLRIFTNKPTEKRNVKWHLPDSFDYLPPNLALLCWEGYPMKSLPSDFCPESLVKLKMTNSNLEKLWEGSRMLPCLKEVNLCGSQNLMEIPDLSRATNLKKLYIEFRLSWARRPSSIQIFNNLKKVGKLECNNMESLPTGMDLESPERLSLIESSRLERMQPLISMNRTIPASLTVLFLSDIPNMVELPFSIQNLSKLKELEITRCINLEVLPTGINLESLKRLNFNGCSRLSTFPDISRNISSLYLEETAIEEVPWWIEKFSKLKYLTMQRCSKLEYVYLNLSKLQHLKLVNFSHCGELTGADWSGYTSSMALEGEIKDTELQVSMEASSSLPDNYVPKVHFSFVNCFNLDLEALIQQLSFKKLILSGERVPSYFTHRTNRSSLSISLLQIPPRSQFLWFRAAAVFCFNSLSILGEKSVCTGVQCRFKSRYGNYFDSPYQKDYFSVHQKGSHLFIFDCRIPLDSQKDLPSEVDVKIRFSSDASYKLKEWGIRLLENGSSSENRLGNPNSLPLVCEANIVDKTEQGEKFGDREKQYMHADSVKKVILQETSIETRYRGLAAVLQYLSSWTLLGNRA